MNIEAGGYILCRQRYGLDKIVTYYYSKEKQTSVWELPSELLEEFRHKEEDYKRRNSQDLLVNGDRARACETVPNSDWRIIYTYGGARFFYNPVSYEKTWEVPDQIRKNQPTAHPEPVLPQSQPQVEQASVGTEMTEDDVAHQLAAMGVFVDSLAFDSNTSAVDHSENFKLLLQEAMITALEPWENVVSKLADDDRFKRIPSNRERKQLFDQYCRELTKNSATSEKKSISNAKDEYRQLVEEYATTKSSWSKFNKQHFSDPRSQAVPFKEREKIFLDHLQALQESRKREKEHRKSRLIEEFTELLDELPRLKQDASWRKTRELIKDDKRYKAIKYEEDREDIFRNYLKSKFQHKRKASIDRTLSDDEEERKWRRQEASIRLREREVRHERQSQQRKEKHQLANLERQGSLDLYLTLLCDLIKDHKMTFRRGLSLLEKDKSFDKVHLEEDELVRFFDSHIENIKTKRLDAFHKLIEERCSLDADTPPPKLAEDPIARHLGETAEIHRQFRRVQTSRLEQAKDDFGKLLEENHYLIFKARNYPYNQKGEDNSIKLDEDALSEVQKTLENDSRFTCLGFLPQVQQAILQEKFKQLVSNERLKVPEFLKSNE